MLSCFDYYFPPLCNDVLLALCKIISLPCATLFFFLPYEIAILFVLHYFFSFPATIFSALCTSIILSCTTLFLFTVLRYIFFLCCIILLFAFALCNHISFLAIHFFLSLQCATLLLSLPYTIMYFLLRCTMFSFLLPSAFFFSDCYHCSAQYNLFSFPLLIFFLVLHWTRM